jgi:ATP-binding cassette, subfamily B, bacterial
MAQGSERPEDVAGAAAGGAPGGRRVQRRGWRAAGPVFRGALGIAALLAIGTGCATTSSRGWASGWSPISASAVFDRVLGMSPAFFERVMTGEVLSRITTDTTLILSVIGSSVSVALRNVLMLIGGMIALLLTSAKLTGLVLLIVPAVIVPIVVLGRRLRVLSRENQDWIAASSGNASEALLSGADRAGLYP